MLNIIL